MTGEIHLDDFDVTHTKDDIVWQEDEEDEVQDGIKERIEDLLKLAREYRHLKAPTTPARRDQALVFDSLVEDTDLGPRMRAAGEAVETMLAEMAPADIVEESAAAVARNLAKDTALLCLDLGHGRSANVFTGRQLGTAVTYLTTSQVSGNSWAFVLNPEHPVCGLTDDLEALRVHLQHAVADGLVSVAFATGRLEAEPATLLVLKDALLRLLSTAD